MVANWSYWHTRYHNFMNKIFFSKILSFSDRVRFHLLAYKVSMVKTKSKALIFPFYQGNTMQRSSTEKDGDERSCCLCVVLYVALAMRGSVFGTSYVEWNIRWNFWEVLSCYRKYSTEVVFFWDSHLLCLVRKQKLSNTTNLVPVPYVYVM